MRLINEISKDRLIIIEFTNHELNQIVASIGRMQFDEAKLELLSHNCKGLNTMEDVITFYEKLREISDFID
jgi:hypothetical protein